MYNRLQFVIWTDEIWITASLTFGSKYLVRYLVGAGVALGWVGTLASPRVEVTERASLSDDRALCTRATLTPIHLANDADASVLTRSDNAAAQLFDTHLANAAHAATALQSGEMQGKASPPHIQTTPAPTRVTKRSNQCELTSSTCW
jgi:hypothetical protein